MGLPLNLSAISSFTTWASVCRFLAALVLVLAPTGQTQASSTIALNQNPNTPSIRIEFEDLGNALNPSQRELLEANIREGFNAWATLINSNSEVRALVKITKTAYGRADCASTSNTTTKTENGIAIVEESTAYKLRTGKAVDPSRPDLIVQVEPHFLAQELWLDPQPQLKTASVPIGKIDAVSVFSHEFGHAIGFQSFRDVVSGEPAPHHMTLFDSFTLKQGAKVVFTGPNILKTMGKTIEITTNNTSQNFRHLGTELPNDDLMNGLSFRRGTRYRVSAIDIAILRDLGLPLK